MATTPTLELCDDLVAALNTAWAPSAPSAVSRKYFVRVGDADDSHQRISGRQVWIFPERYELADETRGEVNYTHRINVVTAERYEDGAGDVPASWVDDRVDFVHTYIVQGFDFGQDGPPSWNRKLVTVSAGVQVYDVEKLMAGGRLFFSLVEFEFAELVG